MCMCICVCTESGTATLGGRVQNEYFKWTHFIWCAQQILNYSSTTMNKVLWFFKSWFLLWTPILVMCPRSHKPSYVYDTALKEYQISITSAVMDWPKAQKWSLAVASYYSKVNSTLQWTLGQAPVYQLTWPSQPPQQLFGGKSNLLVYVWSDNKVRELASLCMPWEHWTKALVWFDDFHIPSFHGCVVVDLWQSLSEWHLLLSACVLVCSKGTHTNCWEAFIPST